MRPEDLSSGAPEAGDRKLLTGIDEALEAAARRSGDWLVCGPGGAECCLGPFAITQLDALRLREGLAALDEGDPERAGRQRLLRRIFRHIERKAKRRANTGRGGRGDEEREYQTTPGRRERWLSSGVNSGMVPEAPL